MLYQLTKFRSAKIEIQDFKYIENKKSFLD